MILIVLFYLARVNVSIDIMLDVLLFSFVVVSYLVLFLGDPYYLCRPSSLGTQSGLSEDLEITTFLV